MKNLWWYWAYYDMWQWAQKAVTITPLKYVMANCEEDTLNKQCYFEQLVAIGMGYAEEVE